MGIDFGRREVRVPEHALHGAKIGATLEQIGRERMAQHMGRDALPTRFPQRVQLPRMRRKKFCRVIALPLRVR